jgi:hypothetical protein
MTGMTPRAFLFCAPFSFTGVLMDFGPQLIVESPGDFKVFTDIFVQRYPKYGVKLYTPGATWKTRNRSLNDGEVKQHLNGDKAVGVVAQWYCEFGAVDFDDREKSEVQEIRASMGFDDKNSLLCTSESDNSYHLLFRPSLNGKPPPAKRFYNAFKVQANENRVEIYPQKNRIFRLPFGRGQELATIAGHLFTQPELLHEFLKLETYEITQLETQKDFDFKGRTIGQGLTLQTYSGFMAEAAGYYQHGLQAPSTRHWAQFCVAALLYRKYNLPPDQVCREVWKWIRTKHNGFSKDIIGYPQRVKYEIKKQVEWLYYNNDLDQNYPDTVHNNYRGYLAKDDLPLILEAAGGSLPRCKFLFEVVKFFYPRKFQVNLSSRELLQRWGSWRTYSRYTKELEQKGLVTRGQSYQVADEDKGIAGRSKSFQLHWPFKSPSECFFIEGRSVETFNEFVKFTISDPREFRQLLQANGSARTTALEAVRGIYR